MRNLTKPSTDTLSPLQIIGMLVLGLLIIMPVLGVFSPPDIWLKYPGNDIAANEALNALPYDQVVVRTTSVMAIFWFLKNWRGYLGEIKYVFLILLQLMAFSSSIFWSDEAVESFAQIYNLGVVFLLLLYVIHRFTVMEYVTFLTRVFGVVALCSFVILIFFPGMAHNFGSDDYLSVWRGAFVQKNALGEASSLAVLTSAYSWYTRANSRKFAALVLAANAILLVGSDSITSMITTMLGLSLYGIAFLSRSFLGKMFLLFLVFGVALLATAVVASETNLAGLVGRTSGLTGRTALWHAVAGMITERPLHGYGMGFWLFRNQDQSNLWLQVGWAPPEAHDDVLDVLLQTGLVGFTFYIINNFTALFLGLRRFGHLHDGSIFCLVIITVFFYRSYTETASVIASGKGVLLLYIAEAYIYKLSFSRQPVTEALPRQRGLRAASGAIS